jgi:hypothetical protein
MERLTDYVLVRPEPVHELYEVEGYVGTERVQVLGSIQWDSAEECTVLLAGCDRYLLVNPA